MVCACCAYVLYCLMTKFFVSIEKYPTTHAYQTSEQSKEFKIRGYTKCVGTEIGAYSDFMNTVLPNKVIIHVLTRFDCFRGDELFAENVQEEFFIL